MDKPSEPLPTEKRAARMMMKTFFRAVRCVIGRCTALVVEPSGKQACLAQAPLVDETHVSCGYAPCCWLVSTSRLLACLTCRMRPKLSVDAVLLWKERIHESGLLTLSDAVPLKRLDTHAQRVHRRIV